ncbi:hypothetical protein EW146_g719 [Bondarzewia mesenterica]|uniref:Uncharacterized protein n=1 Tax=Bondarzewia mesenterica TaxID=1095465 RepID=A0A4S4M656_9AGAM|nr:hypothetical protein EW146_g719 [Bondarzewia mesenterica]
MAGMAPPLLSRGLDPILGVFTGVLAYYLYENNPRTALPPDQKLETLIRWKIDKVRAERSAKQEDDVNHIDWRQVISEEK